MITPVAEIIARGIKENLDTTEKLLNELQIMNSALKNINKTLEESVISEEYKRSHSNCCDADILVGDVCADCKEHCANQLD
jgi:hypothetical protein